MTVSQRLIIIVVLILGVMSPPGLCVDLCTVSGILYGPDGNRLDNAEVFFRLSSSVRDTASGIGVGNYEIYATSNDTGYVSVSLIRNGNCVPDSYYEVAITRSDISPLNYEMFIPADSSAFDFIVGGTVK